MTAIVPVEFADEASEHGADKDFRSAFHDKCRQEISAFKSHHMVYNMMK